MESDDIQAAWATIDARLARQEELQLALLRQDGVRRARRNLRPLAFGMGLQLLLGIGLVLLGVGCWSNNPDNAGLLVAGIALHAFGIAHIIFAGQVLALATGIGDDVPVLALQRRLRRLLRIQVLNSAVCGAPWWILWVLVVVGVSGLGARHAGPTPAWIWVSLALGAAGTLATWAWAARTARRPDALSRRVDDGGNGIRRNLAIIAEIGRFEDELRAP